MNNGTQKSVLQRIIFGGGILFSSIFLFSLVFTFFSQHQEAIGIKADQMHKYGQYYLFAIIISTIVQLICYMGLWKMKKWAAILFPFEFILSALVLLIFFRFNTSTLSYIFFIITVAIIWKYFKQMT